MAPPNERAQIAYVLRRFGFGPAPGQVDTWVEKGLDALLDSLLSQTDDPSLPELPDGLDPARIDDDGDFIEAILTHVLASMMHGPDPVRERLTWFWHGHFTSSFDTAGPAQIWQQHRLIRRHALGHFPTLLREVTTDAAMLLYLNGAASLGDDPNENHARELLELFALGRNGGYDEDDVRAAARIMAGWTVDWDTGEVAFDPQRAYLRPVTFMGVRQRWTLDTFIDHICGQRACAEHIVGRLHAHLVGPELTDAQRDELVDVFTGSGLEIQPLVAAIARSVEVGSASQRRTRQPLEWLIGARHALGFDSAVDADELWRLEALGQVPFEPPNVAGWPLDDRWSSTSQLINRTASLLDWSLPEAVFDEVLPTVDAVLARCGIHDLSSGTRAALDTIESEVAEYDGRLELLFATVLLSPEFSTL